MSGSTDANHDIVGDGIDGRGELRRTREVIEVVAWESDFAAPCLNDGRQHPRPCLGDF